MKTYLETMLRGALAVLAGCGLAVRSQAAVPVSPVGTWDCFLTGAHGQKGIAFLTFSDDGTNRTFSGFQLLVGKSTSASDSTDRSLTERNAVGDITRNGFAGGSASGSSSFISLFGFGDVAGPWTYDNKGRVIGSFTELVNATGTRTNFGSVCISNEFIFVTNNVLLVTNLSFCFNTAEFTTNVTWTDPTNASTTFTFNNTNFTVGPSSVETTNQISFVGKVVHGRRLTLRCSTTFGNAIYRGVPYTTNLKNLSGEWQAARKENGQTFLEFFDLTSFGTGNPFNFPDTITNFPNIYFTTNNSGPGYTNSAIAALSSHKKIGFSFYEGTNSTLLGASFGNFNAGKKATKFTTKGIRLPDTQFKFDAILVP